MDGAPNEILNPGSNEAAVGFKDNFFRPDAFSEEAGLVGTAVVDDVAGGVAGVVGVDGAAPSVFAGFVGEDGDAVGVVVAFAAAPARSRK